MTEINNNNNLHDEQEGNRVIQKMNGMQIYCRSSSPQSKSVVEKYEEAHQINGHNIKKVKLVGKLTMSGLSSIYLTMATLVNLEKSNNGVNIIVSNELYCDTPKIIKSFGCNIVEIDVTKPEGIEKEFQILKNQQSGKANILFVESASNPSGNIFDFEIIPKLRKLSSKLYVVVDNTWLTHIIFNPFQYDVDVVVNSCSKYYSAGECISGMIISKNPFMSHLENLSRLMGNHVSVDYCKILSINFETMYDRLISAHKNTVALTKVLKSYGLEIRNSSNPDDPSHLLANKYYKKIQGSDGETIHPSVIKVIVNKPIDQVYKLILENNIPAKTSFGSSYTKVCNFMKPISPEITQIRISVGYGKEFNPEMFSFLK